MAGAQPERPSLLFDELQAQVEQLAAGRDWFMQFFEHAAEAHLLTDRYATIRSANAAAAGLLGRSSTSLAGKPLAVFVPLPERMQFRRLVNEVPVRARWRCAAFTAEVRRSPLGLCWTLT